MRKSAGLLLYKKLRGDVHVFLVHPGGPFWRGKDQGAWSIPKGEFEEGEEPLSAAKREFKEETGQEVDGVFIELKAIKQKSGKLVYAWGVEADVDANSIVSNRFKLEYPSKSGKWIEIPEVDKASWFTEEEAKQKINPAQSALIDDLLQKLRK